jgi:hypothetical protein
MARAARRLERKRQQRRVLEAKVKTARSPSIGFIGRKRPLRIARPALLTVKIRQPSHEFTFGVGMSFIPYPLVLTPVV